MDIEPPDGFAGELRPFQREGLCWLGRLSRWAPGACLADDMGLGKTAQALALLLLRRARGPALVIAPTSVERSWQAEAQRFTPELRVRRWRGAQRGEVLGSLRNGDLVIVGWGSLAPAIAELAGVSWATVVFDEAQQLKNPRSKRHAAARRLDAGFRLGLTGTPVENSPYDLWSLFGVLVPDLLGTRADFSRRWASPIARGVEGAAANLGALVGPFLLRRTKQQVAPELPPVSEVRQVVELSLGERQRYERAREAGLAQLTRDRAAAAPGLQLRALATLTELRQLACDPGLVDPHSEQPSTKLDAAEALISEVVASGAAILVFSQFTTLLGRLAERLDAASLPWLQLDGSTPERRRAELVERFERGEAPVFLISPLAGGTGLTLTAASCVLHLDPWWNPAVEDQASDRAHRIGQRMPVTVVRLLAADTVEERVEELQQHKRDQIAALLAGASAARGLSTDELIDLIRTGGEVVLPLPAAPEPKVEVVAAPAQPARPRHRRVGPTRVDDVLAGRAEPTIEELLRLIHAVNPTDRALPRGERELRYEQKAALQSLLVERFGEALTFSRHSDAGVVGIEHSSGTADACHAVIERLTAAAQGAVEAALAPPPATPPAPAKPRTTPPPNAVAKARAALDEWDYDAARDLLDAQVHAAVGDREALNLLVELLVDYLGDDEAALALLGRHERAIAGDGGTRRRVALAAARRGQRRVVGQLVADQDGVATIYEALCRALLASGALDEAGRALDGLRQDDPADPSIPELERSLESAREQLASSLLAEAQALFDADLLDRAHALAREVVALGADDGGLVEQIRGARRARSREAELDAAREALGRGDADAAALRLKAARSLGATSAELERHLSALRRGHRERERDQQAALIRDAITQGRPGDALELAARLDQALLAPLAPLHRQLGWLWTLRARLEPDEALAEVRLLAATQRCREQGDWRGVLDSLGACSRHALAVAEVDDWRRWAQGEAEAERERDCERLVERLRRALDGLDAVEAVRLDAERRELGAALDRRLRRQLAALQRAHELRAAWLEARSRGDAFAAHEGALAFTADPGPLEAEAQRARTEAEDAMQEALCVTVLRDLQAPLRSLPGASSELAPAWCFGDAVLLATAAASWINLRCVGLDGEERYLACLKAPGTWYEFDTTGDEAGGCWLVSAERALRWDPVAARVTRCLELGEAVSNVELDGAVVSGHALWVTTEQRGSDSVVATSYELRSGKRLGRDASDRLGLYPLHESRPGALAQASLDQSRLRVLDDRARCTLEVAMDPVRQIYSHPSPGHLLVLTARHEALSLSVLDPGGAEVERVDVDGYNAEALRFAALDADAGLLFIMEYGRGGGCILSALPLQPLAGDPTWDVEQMGDAVLARDASAGSVHLLLLKEQQLTTHHLGVAAPPAAAHSPPQRRWRSALGSRWCSGWYGRRLEAAVPDGPLPWPPPRSAKERKLRDATIRSIAANASSDPLTPAAMILKLGRLPAPSRAEELGLARRAHAENPDDPLLRLLLAHAEAGEGRWLEVRELLTDLDIEPLEPSERGHRLHLLAEATLDLGDFEAAQAHATAAANDVACRCDTSATIAIARGALCGDVDAADLTERQVARIDRADAQDDPETVIELLDTSWGGRRLSVHTLGRLARAFLTVTPPGPRGWWRTREVLTALVDETRHAPLLDGSPRPIRLSAEELKGIRTAPFSGSRTILAGQGRRAEMLRATEGGARDCAMRVISLHLWPQRGQHSRSWPKTRRRASAACRPGGGGASRAAPPAPGLPYAGERSAPGPRGSG